MDCKHEDLSQIRIERPFYEHQQLREDFCYEKPKKLNAAKEWSDNFRLKKFLVGILPVSDWLLKYNWKKDILADVISGVTVAIMHIPQGMAYAMLGNVPAVVGIYMAFFPVLVYFLFGTSKHNSMGTFSIACLMTGKAVLEHSDPAYFSTDNLTDSEPTGYSPIEVATAVTFIVALFQLVMYVLRLGAISALLSETLVSGFITGAAVQVLVSQIKDLLGLTIPKFKGYFTNVNTIVAVFQELDQTNIAALIISTITITVSAINNDYFKPIVAKRSPFPFPMELIAVVVGTLVSRYCNLVKDYGVKVVGDIPVGLPMPALPDMALLPSLIVDGLTTAIVSYTISLSMGLIFAQKLDYEVDANQELFAMGASNIFGSFFSCMPVCASLSRSLIQQVVGGVSQIASIVSCLILLIVLLWIGPFFEALPKAVLASVIVVALKGMLMQVLDFWKFWKLSKIDALVWMGTFLAVVFIGIDIGLLVGIILSLGSIFLLNIRSHTYLLGQVPNTDLYLDIARYKAAKEIDGIKIFHYSGGINFATKSMFKADLIRLVGLNPQKEVVYRAKLAKYLEKFEKKERSMKAANSLTNKLEKVQNKVNIQIRCLILDFSSVSYIDPSGVTMLKSVMESFIKLDIPVYIANCKGVCLAEIELPPVDLNKLDGVSQIKNQCDKKNPNSYDLLKSAINETKICLEGKIVPNKIKEELEEAKKTGSMDEVFAKYCNKREEYKSCIMKTVNATKDCLEETDKTALDTGIKLVTEIVDFACFKDGDRLAMFVAEGGIECIESRTSNILNCVNATLKINVDPNQGLSRSALLNNLPTLKIDKKKCDDFAAIRECVVTDLENNCKDTTPANIIDALFKFINKATCKNLKQKRSMLDS